MAKFKKAEDGSWVLDGWVMLDPSKCVDNEAADAHRYTAVSHQITLHHNTASTWATVWPSHVTINPSHVPIQNPYEFPWRRHLAPFSPFTKVPEEVRPLPPTEGREREAAAQVVARSPRSFPPRPADLPCDVCATCKRTVAPDKGVFWCKKCGDVWMVVTTDSSAKPKPDMVPDFILKRRAKVPARRVVPTEGLADMDHLVPDEVPNRFGIGR